MAREGKSYDEILAAVRKGEKPSSPPVTTVSKVEPAAWSPIRGEKLAKVTLVVFSDYQCPFCARLEPTLVELRGKYGKKLRIVRRHQPLPFHANAMPAAEAAMAANAQGKFWPMHDRLFADQAHLDDQSLRRHAEAIHLDMAKFDEDMREHRYRSQVEADSKYGGEHGASGTPTLFINGRMVVGAQPVDALTPIIDDEVKHADRLLRRGVKMEDLYRVILDELKEPPKPKPGEASPAPVEVFDVRVPADAPSRGPKDAPVTLVEFADFQCPFCGRVQPTLLALEEKYAGKIRVVYMHQPLPFHQHAELAAEASMAAAAQGKFWEMHDKLYANQGALLYPDLEGYAREIGLDMTKFAAALDKHIYAERVRSDAKEGVRVSANGTPTFFINGIRLVGAQPAASFETLIDEAIAKRREAPDAKGQGGTKGKARAR